MDVKLIIVVNVILIIFSSCNRSDCYGTKQHELTFKYIKVLEEYKNNDDILIGRFLEANLVLAELTEIQSSANYGEINLYPRKSLKKDLKNWRDWMVNESCKIDLDSIKHKEQKLLKSLDWIEK